MEAKIILGLYEKHFPITIGKLAKKVGAKLRKEYPLISKNIFENIKLVDQQEVALKSITWKKKTACFVYEISPVDMGLSCQKAL